MWPFDDPKHQIPANVNVPKLGPTPSGDPRDLKILELEQRLFGMECALIEICTALRSHADNCTYNFETMEQSFINLVHYVTQPSVTILGEHKEKN